MKSPSANFAVFIEAFGVDAGKTIMRATKTLHMYERGRRMWNMKLTHSTFMAMKDVWRRAIIFGSTELTIELKTTKAQNTPLHK